MGYIYIGVAGVGAMLKWFLLLKADWCAGQVVLIISRGRELADTDSELNYKGTIGQAPC